VIEVDARPSDAIILALKSKIPIFVSAKILDQQGIALTKEEALGERYGIRIQELTPSLASNFNFKGKRGVLVAEVLSGSASETSGIKAGDIITKVNLKRWGVYKNLKKYLTRPRQGIASDYTFRDDKFQEINLLLNLKGMLNAAIEVKSQLSIFLIIGTLKN